MSPSLKAAVTKRQIAPSERPGVGKSDGHLRWDPQTKLKPKIQTDYLIAPPDPRLWLQIIGQIFSNAASLGTRASQRTGPLWAQQEVWQSWRFLTVTQRIK